METRTKAVIVIALVLIFLIIAIVFKIKSDRKWKATAIPPADDSVSKNVQSKKTGIISAIIEPNFWTGALWIIICSGWLLSAAGAILGARLGKKNEHTYSDSENMITPDYE